MKYRREIDGLRAVAVLPVILFHAGFQTFSGGFVGVDVFFVISGYLISTIILSELDSGSFSVVNFYERRARRILPALFFVILVTAVFSWFWLMPEHLQNFSESMAAVATFGSNILFWRQDDYFAAAAELKPLLHTWSLAVEEQFYVLFPVFLWAVVRYARRYLFPILIGVTLLSFGVAEWGAHNDRRAAFFLLPTRGWEMSIGALLAYYFLYLKKVDQQESGGYTAQVGGIIGFSLILAGIFLYSKSTPFPGRYALLPTVGTSLVILYAHPWTLVGRLLSATPMVGIGLISYSAYLWHQPMFALARHRSLTALSAGELLALAGGSLVLGYLSWRFVEGPFRNKQRFGRKKIFAYAVSASALMLAVGLVGHFKGGWSSRVQPEVLRVLEAAKGNHGSGKPWVGDQGFRVFQSGAVVSKYLYLIGDSHAQALAEALRDTLADSVDGIGFMASSMGGCLPIDGVYRKWDGENKCYQHRTEVQRVLAERSDIEYVVLAGRWTLALTGHRFDNLEGGAELGEPVTLEYISESRREPISDETSTQVIAERIEQSILALLAYGKKVIIVGQVPEAGWNVPEYIAKLMQYSGVTEITAGTASTSAMVNRERNRGIDSLLARLEHPNLAVIQPSRLFCDTLVTDRCVTTNGNDVYYFDDDHLSYAGASLVADKVVESMRLLASRQNLQEGSPEVTK